MARAKKNGVHINYYIDKDIKEMLDKYSMEMGQTNTLALERILKSYFEEYYKKKEKDVN